MGGRGGLTLVWRGGHQRLQHLVLLARHARHHDIRRLESRDPVHPDRVLLTESVDPANDLNGVHVGPHGILVGWLHRREVSNSYMRAK